jgi:hypothetical protein
MIWPKPIAFRSVEFLAFGECRNARPDPALDLIAETLGKLLRGGDWQPERFAHELGDAAYYWTRLCCATGVAPSDLLARSESNIERRSLS